ncbi:hypothetical protein MMC19_007474 [Ptychographa xylographoides]|nr:hypothetical protein [Ptychographa xylographoides]
MSAPQPKVQSIRQWPPPPSVEDEVISLLREYSPSVPELVGGEAQFRGIVDQQPLFLEVESRSPIRVNTERPKTRENSDIGSLRSKSSSESLGIQTPPESAHTDNPERRYVWRPEGAAAFPETQNEPMTRQGANGFSVQTPPRAERQEEEKSYIGMDNRAGMNSEEKTRPMTSARDVSPYTHSPHPTSSKSGSSWEYLTSPEILSPNDRSSILHKDVKARQRGNNSDFEKPSGHYRATSNSASVAERPVLGTRHRSAMAIPGEPMPLKIPRSPASKVEGPFAESGREPAAHPTSKADNYYAHIRPGQSRQAAALRYGEAVQQGKKNPLYSPRPITPPLRHFSGTWEGFPTQEPRKYIATGPVTAPLPKIAAKTRSSLSPYPSPMPSPRSTPPPSPGSNTKRYSVETPLSGRRSGPVSRPSSPLSSAPPSRAESLRLPDESHFKDYKSSIPPRSRHTSPLPSPEPERSTNRLSNPVDKKDPPTPVNRSRSSTHVLEVPVRPRSREASAPFVLSQPPRSQPLRIPPTRRTHSAIGSRETPNVDTDLYSRSPSEFPSSPQHRHSTKKPTTPRPNPSLPACLRPNFLPGYSDWSTIHSCPDFDICPPCRKAIEDAGWEGQFYPSQPRPPAFQTRCDLSIPWVRMAWLLVLQKREPHPHILHQLMAVIAKVPPCPANNGELRNWYRLYNPETGRQVSSFDVCPCCLGSLETIFPNLKGTFQLAQLSNPHQKRICDLRSESTRFPKYVDMLEEISTQANLYRRPPNMLRFVHLVQSMADIRECTRDDMVLGQPWHFIPHLPEFTVCEECYNHVVWPHIAEGFEIAGSFNRTLQMLPPSSTGTSCQLYSVRTREIFENACRRNDWAGLRATAVHRVTVERGLQMRLAQVRIYGDGGEETAQEVKSLVEEWKKWE